MPSIAAFARAGALALLLSSPALAETTLTVAGSGEAIALAKRLADDHASRTDGVSFHFPASLGTRGGIVALGARAIDIALLGRPLSEAEAAKGLVTVPLCRTPLVFVTARKNIPASLSSAELVAILGQRMTTWPDGRVIRAVLRPATEPDTETLGCQLDGFAGAYAVAAKVVGIPVPTTSQENLDIIKTVPGSFGWTALAAVRAEARPLTAIALDGVNASGESLMAGRYPYSRNFYLGHRADAPPATRAFVHFVGSAAAKTILQSLDCVALAN